jgi:hypothetical protein
MSYSPSQIRALRKCAVADIDLWFGKEYALTMPKQLICNLTSYPHLYTTTVMIPNTPAEFALWLLETTEHDITIYLQCTHTETTYDFSSTVFPILSLLGMDAGYNPIMDEFYVNTKMGIPGVYYYNDGSIGPPPESPRYWVRPTEEATDNRKRKRTDSTQPRLVRTTISHERRKLIKQLPSKWRLAICPIVRAETVVLINYRLGMCKDVARLIVSFVHVSAR